MGTYAEHSLARQCFARARTRTIEIGTDCKGGLLDTDAIILRQGRIVGDYGLAKRLKIIARNGKSSCLR